MASTISLEGEYFRPEGRRRATRAGIFESGADLLGRALIRWSRSRARRRELAMESHTRATATERERARRESDAYRIWNLGG